MESVISIEIKKLFREVFLEKNNGLTPPEIGPESILLETGLDSLGFAILVIQLEERLGFDPFVISTEPYYPKTFGDFISFYEENQPK
jgi:acyl carrier protein